MIIAVGVIGLLSAIALPSYYKQAGRTRQNECVATMSQVITATMGFNDEFSEPPTSWADLNTVSAVMKESGTAGNDNHFNPIDLNNENYIMSAKINGDIYTYECIPKKSIDADYNVLGCLDLNNGASEIKRGKEGEPAKIVNCTAI